MFKNTIILLLLIIITYMYVITNNLVITNTTNKDLESVNIVIKDDNNKIDVLRSLSDKDSIRINTSNISNDASIIITEGMDVYCSFESLKEVKNNISLTSDKKCSFE